MILFPGGENLFKRSKSSILLREGIWLIIPGDRVVKYEYGKTSLIMALAVFTLLRFLM